MPTQSSDLPRRGRGRPRLDLSPEERLERRREQERRSSAKRYAANRDAIRERQRLYQKGRYGLSSEEILSRQHSRGLPCRGCGVQRAVPAKDRERVEALGGPLCHTCRRAEAARIDQLAAEFRAKRLATQEPPSLRRGKQSGKRGGHPDTWTYRRNRILVLAASDMCGICGHGGSLSVDHVVPHRLWPRDEHGKMLPGFDAFENLQPAHGSLGSTGMVNRCGPCGGRLCNQSRGIKPLRPIG
jgi:5-methylcytosine-specific restriction endonuclease McrA